MRLRPIHFVPDVPAAVAFYEAVGLVVAAHSRSGHWVELEASGGGLALHDAAIAADGAGRSGLALNLVADEPLEDVERRLRRAGFPPDGTIVDDLAATVDRLRAAGAHFRNEIVDGVGGRQILLDDPSGNPVELFEPTLAVARLAPDA